MEDAFKIIKEKEKNIHFQFLEKKFNLIFCDPPFKNENIDVLIEMIFLQKILEKNGIIILHRHKNTKDIMPNYFKILDERVYGLSKIIFGNFYSSSS